MQNNYLLIRIFITNCLGEFMNTTNIHNETENPLADIISNEVYDILNRYGLINHKSVRDYHIRRTFKNLRSAEHSAGDAIDKIRQTYPYLQFDTIRKIGYQPHG